jgi:hypothetical protein
MSEKKEEKTNVDNTQIVDDNTRKVDNNDSPPPSEDSEVLVKKKVDKNSKKVENKEENQKKHQKEKKIKKNVIVDSDEDDDCSSDNEDSNPESEHQDQPIGPPGSAPPDQTFEDPKEMVQSVKKFARDHGYTISLKTTNETRKVFKCSRYFIFLHHFFLQLQSF